MKLCPRHIGALATALLLAFGPPLHADDSAELASLVEKNADAYVTVKFVLKIESEAGNREIEAEITGVMIDPAGLILCGNSRLGASRMLRQYGATATPTDIKVLIGDDTEGLPARILARDSELDLAWVQIKDLKGKSVKALELKHAGTASLGQHILALRRMAKYFDRALTVSEGILSGKTKKPRDLLIPGPSLVLEPGLPVYTRGGEILGVFAVPILEDDELQSMAGSGIGRDLQTGVILPTAEVIKATQRARDGALSKEDSDAPAKPAGKKPADAGKAKDAGAGDPPKKSAEDDDEE